MIDWKRQLKEYLVDSLPLNLGVLLIGIVGYIVLGCLYFFFERRKAGHPRSFRLLLADVFPRAMYDHYSARLDMWLFVPMVFFFAPLAALLTTIAGLIFGIDVSTALAHMFGKQDPLLPAAWLLATIQFMTYMIGYDFGQWVGHYALHRVPLLWAIHRAHHSAETLNFFTNPRAHPLELLILIGCRVAFASLTVGVTFYLTGSTLQPGTTAALAFYNIAFLGFYTMLTHSHIPISFGGRFNILIAGPVMHQIHHSAEARHMDKNLGGAPGHIFDWLFGTLYLPNKGETFVVGLNEVEYGANNPYRTPRDFFFEPFVYARRLLCRTEATDSEASTQVGEAKGETTV